METPARNVLWTGVRLSAPPPNKMGAYLQSRRRAPFCVDVRAVDALPAQCIILHVLAHV